MANNVLKHDATVGRLLLIDVANPPDLTAEEFMSYINEGFVPVLCVTSSGTAYSFAMWNKDGDGIVNLSVEGGGSSITFYPKDYVPEESNESED